MASGVSRGWVGIMDVVVGLVSLTLGWGWHDERWGWVGIMDIGGGLASRKLELCGTMAAWFGSVSWVCIVGWYHVLVSLLGIMG